MAREKGEWGMTANKFKNSLRGDENVLKLLVDSYIHSILWIYYKNIRGVGNEWMDEWIRINKSIHPLGFLEIGIYTLTIIYQVLMECWAGYSLLPVSPPCCLHLWAMKFPPKECTSVLSHLLIFLIPTEGSHLTQKKNNLSYCPGMRKCSDK